VEDFYNCDAGLPEPFALAYVDALAAIQCADEVSKTSDLQSSQVLYEKMVEVSPFFGPVGAWIIQSNDPFNYSFVQNMSFPSMLIANMEDPVTAISA
jgi:hypothetical protein